jgi:hypothetical protein
MEDSALLDDLFRDAVSAIDAGDLAALEHQLNTHPTLARERLESPGSWLRDQVGDALDDFFQRPYLLWFVAEDPVRNGKLPKNIASLAGAIIRRAKGENTGSLQEQLDYALRLVCWSWIARDCGVQIELVDILVDAGASVEGRNVLEGRYGTQGDSAIYNANFAAAERLLERGAPLTLTMALCLGRWADVDRLAAGATLDEKQDAFVQAAKHGQAQGLRRMLAHGVDATTVSARIQSHGTALHHAALTGSLDAVKVLVEAGADLGRRDTIYDATPLGWAKYAEQTDARRARQHAVVAAYLSKAGGRE